MRNYTVWLHRLIILYKLSKFIYGNFINHIYLTFESDFKFSFLNEDSSIKYLFFCIQFFLVIMLCVSSFLKKMTLIMLY